MYTLFSNTVMKSSVIANTQSGTDDCFHVILPHQGENMFMFPVLSPGFQFLCVSVAPVNLGQISSDSSLNKQEYLCKYKYRAAQIKSPSFLHPGSNLPEQMLTH